MFGHFKPFTSDIGDLKLVAVPMVLQIQHIIYIIGICEKKNYQSGLFAFCFYLGHIVCEIHKKTIENLAEELEIKSKTLINNSTFSGTISNDYGNCIIDDQEMKDLFSQVEDVFFIEPIKTSLLNGTFFSLLLSPITQFISNNCVMNSNTSFLYLFRQKDLLNKVKEHEFICVFTDNNNYPEMNNYVSKGIPSEWKRLFLSFHNKYFPIALARPQSPVPSADEEPAADFDATLGRHAANCTNRTRFFSVEHSSNPLLAQTCLMVTEIKTCFESGDGLYLVVYLSRSRWQQVAQDLVRWAEFDYSLSGLDSPQSVGSDKTVVAVHHFSSTSCAYFRSLEAAVFLLLRSFTVDTGVTASAASNLRRIELSVRRCLLERSPATVPLPAAPTSPLYAESLRSPTPPALAPPAGSTSRAPARRQYTTAPHR